MTVLDGAPEMLELNRARCEHACMSRGVRYRAERVDLFDWSPTSRHDVVFFGFWLSHVPEDRFDAFYTLAPHPAFTQIDGVTDPFPIDRPSPI